MSDAAVRRAVASVQEYLRGNDELRSTEFDGADGLTGHCYVAAEAVFHLTGGYDQWYVCRLTVDTEHHERDVPARVTHWFLEDRDTGEIVDPTSSQFDFAPEYDRRTRTGFMTSDPSERAQTVLDELEA